MKTSKQRRAVTDAESQRLNVRLDASAYQRLMIHCVMSGTQPGKFLATLIDTHCRAWRVQAVQASHAGLAAPSVSAPSTAEGKPNDAVAA
jgi:hypothetical protein